ncbi:MAG: ATP phosphoribosyltransferase regulatory subunit [Clostridia bacterium]|nr:ATP phosphoribosyltransferase regulatory subunit [Clostridia bacterium]
MKNYSKITPEGTKDYLALESRAIRCAEKRLSALYKSKGYQKVMTPTIEFFDVFNRESSGYSPENLYSLTDSYGRLLVLRPDSTLPIARLASTRLQNAVLPLRIYYNQNVFLRQKNLTGRSDESTQSGIELMGVGGIRADLEVIATAVEAIECCTAADFKLEIGHAGFFKDLCNNLNVDDETISAIYDCVESRNFVSLNKILDKIGENSVTDCIRNLPRYFGGLDIIEKAKQIGIGNESLEYLKELYVQLEKMGLSDKIIIDLSLVNRTNYYTGIIFKGYLDGSGISVVSGGRYDLLAGEFGKDMPSTGFGIETGALASVMISRNEVEEEIVPQIIVWGADNYITNALEYSKTLRSKEIFCEMSDFSSAEETVEYAKQKGIKTVCIIDENGMSEVQL